MAAIGEVAEVATGYPNVLGDELIDLRLPQAKSALSIGMNGTLKHEVDSDEPDGWTKLCKDLGDLSICLLIPSIRASPEPLVLGKQHFGVESRELAVEVVSGVNYPERHRP